MREKKDLNSSLFVLHLKNLSIMEVKTVGIACDHAGFPLKQFVLEYLEKKGYPVKDYGTYSDASVDLSLIHI